MSALLDVRGLSVQFASSHGRVQAVDDVSLTVGAGEIVGLVGESGCGKSVATMSLLRLLPPTATVSGEAWFEGTNLLVQSPRQLRAVRGRKVSFIFQEPMSSLNPLFTIGEQITEVMRKHLGLSRREARRRAVNLLETVRIADPARRLSEYPHQLSGGMCQRAMIAMAIACQPKLLIADEPTTALDVTIQTEVLDLLRDLRDELGMAVILITHNLGVVADIVDRVCVMYAGRKIEEAPVEEIFRASHHPYTRGLIAAVPRLGNRVDRLEEIPGHVPVMHGPASMCSFAPRCPRAADDCVEYRPELEPLERNHTAACFHPYRAPV